MSWKGVQGGKPEGEERMRGSALSSPMGVPLGYFREYKKNEEDKRKRNVRAPLSRLPLPYGFPLSNPFPLPIPLYWRALTIKMVEIICVQMISGLYGVRRLLVSAFW